MGLAAAALVTTTGGARAQEIEEITVTAQRRSSALQDVPIAITVMTDKEIAIANFSDTRSLAAEIPNFQISSPWGAANTGLFIRGIGNADVNATANAKIGTYQDQVFTGLQVGQNFQLFDLERIEVLKGPQGTLYGKNTTGGALNIVSHQPKAGDQDGYVTFGGGNYDALTIEAAKSFSLADRLSARIAGVVNRRDGTARNLVTGRRQNNVDNHALRALLHYEGDNFTALLRFQHGRNRGDFRQGKPDTRLGPNGASVTGFVNPSNDPFKLTTDVDNYLNVNQDGVALVAEWDLGAVALTSVSSYDKAKLRALQDADHSADSLIQIGWRTNSNLFAQELRLTSQTKGPFEYIVGLFLSRERVGDGTGSDFYIFGDVPPNPPANSLSIKQDLAQKADQYAAFADFTYHLTDRFSVNGGLRYTIDHKEFWTVAELVAAGGAPQQGVFTVPYTAFDRTWKKWSGHVGAQFRPSDDVMVYAGFSRGFNGGGFNGGAITDPGEATAFAPEYLNAYEAGVKTSLFDHRATLNISGFYYDYKNLQVQTITTSPFSNNFIQIIENASNAVIYGSEIEMSARITRELRLQAAVGLLHSKYKNFTSLVGNANGHRLDQAPTLDYSGSAHYERDLGANRGSIFLRGELSLQTRQYYNSAQRKDVSSGGTNETVNVKLGWISPSQSVRVTAYVNNLTDNSYVDRAIDLVGGFGFVSRWYTDPRTYGVQLSYNFN